MVNPVAHIPLQDAEAAARLARRANSPHGDIWALLDKVSDPEIPVLSLWDLGVLQDVTMQDDTVVVVITPTYSGCPAMTVMVEDIERALHAAGYASVRVQHSLTPVWGTHLMSEEAKVKLREFQIAPPAALACPQCGSREVELVSEFSSTACKALYRCASCAEPFDYFKPH